VRACVRAGVGACVEASCHTGAAGDREALEPKTLTPNAKPQRKTIKQAREAIERAAASRREELLSGSSGTTPPHPPHTHTHTHTHGGKNYWLARPVPQTDRERERDGGRASERAGERERERAREGTA
jgi:hypothetical protein